jgi:hypothetical protein
VESGAIPICAWRKSKIQLGHNNRFSGPAFKPEHSFNQGGALRNIPQYLVNIISTLILHVWNVNAQFNARCKMTNEWRTVLSELLDVIGKIIGDTYYVKGNFVVCPCRILLLLLLLFLLLLLLLSEIQEDRLYWACGYGEGARDACRIFVSKPVSKLQLWKARRKN